MLHMTVTKILGPFCLKLLTRFSKVSQSHIYWVHGTSLFTSMLSARRDVHRSSLGSKQSLKRYRTISSELLHIGYSYYCHIFLIFLLRSVGRALWYAFQNRIF